MYLLLNFTFQYRWYRWISQEFSVEISAAETQVSSDKHESKSFM